MPELRRGDLYRRRAKAQRQRRIDDFAECLARGYSLCAAASAVGVSQQAGSNYFKQIRGELGWQAQ
jgi:hypothetical protein